VLMCVPTHASIQTHEGGLGGEPGNEAHGGYTYCGLAALCILNRTGALDLPHLLHWAAQVWCGMWGGVGCRVGW
jgi:protein farnesyltransferase subunit beta